MSQQEVNRHHVIRSVLEGRATQAQAGKTLGLTPRQVRRLCVRVRQKGARGVIHGLRVRPSNHQLDRDIVERALCALHEPLWEGFGPTFARDKLNELHGLTLSDWTVRQLMTQAGLWQPGKQAPRHRAWRERRACVGMLVQLDGSDHDWFEGRGPRCVLIIYIDDATSQILYGEFVKVEDTLTLMRTTQSYLRRHGRPVAFYVDKDSIYKINRPAKYESLELGEQPMTQFTRAMSELGVEVIPADSPQAKGRVERGFDTHQDRLVKELRLRGISTMRDANILLWERYILGHNQRYAVAATNPANAHRSLLATHRLEQILSLREERTLMNDYTVRHNNKFYQILERQIVRIKPGDKLEVEQRLDGSTHLRFEGSYLNFKPLAARPYRPLLEAQPSRLEQMHGYVPGSKPAKEHPWRQTGYFRKGPYRVGLPAVLLGS
jgi:hypothetical protein